MVRVDNMESNSDLDKLYTLQEQSMKIVLDDPDQKQHSETWLRNDTVDYWRHKRMRDEILPLLHHFPESKWLTVGDGRYGTDAHYLIEKGFHAHASDIQDDLLKIGHEKGFIQDFSRQNAEQLTFLDNEFDFTMCKEAYHHFPRPSIALYEMLRVSKKGAVLIEPLDNLFFDSVFRILVYKIKVFVKKLIGKKVNIHSFETSGNYVFSLSSRDLQKYALGMHFDFIAHKVIHDYYEKGVEFEIADTKSRLFNKIKKKIKKATLLYRLGLNNTGIIIGIILKKTPDMSVITNLELEGFVTEIMPKNPYL